MGSSSRNSSNGEKILQVVTFRLETRCYAVPLFVVNSIQRMVAVSPLPAAPEWMAGVIDIRGSVVPVVNLRSRLGHPPRPFAIEDRLLVVERRGRRMALIVDEVMEVLEVTRRELEQSTEILTPCISAVIRRDAGAMLLVLDVDEVIPSDTTTPSLERRF